MSCVLLICRQVDTRSGHAEYWNDQLSLCTNLLGNLLGILICKVGISQMKYYYEIGTDVFSFFPLTYLPEDELIFNLPSYIALIPDGCTCSRPTELLFENQLSFLRAKQAYVMAVFYTVFVQPANGCCRDLIWIWVHIEQALSWIWVQAFFLIQCCMNHSNGHAV